MLARFLFVRPLPWNEPAPLPTDDVERRAAAAALQRIYTLPAGAPSLSLTGEARAAFERFHRAHHAAIHDLAGKAAAWWGKGPRQVLRLAGVLTFLDWSAQAPGTAEPQQVPAWAIDAAVSLWRDYLWPHAQATLRLAGAGGEREDRKRQVLRWLRKHRLEEVSREDIRRQALSQALDAAATSRLIDELEDAGWLRPAHVAYAGHGRRRHRWQVNPRLWAEAGEDNGRDIIATVETPRVKFEPVEGGRSRDFRRPTERLPPFPPFPQASRRRTCHRPTRMKRP